MKRQTADQTQRAKSLRQQQTASEGLLWSVLRGSQLCGVKFRRQHPIGPFFADFACIAHRLVVELDGGYHDAVQDQDLHRQRYLISQGWKVIRFCNEDVLKDIDSVLQAIATNMSLPYEHRSRSKACGGMLSDQDPNVPRPHPAAHASDLPSGEVKD